MGELRANDVRARNGETLTELRCPEQGCGRLLLRFSQAAGSSLVETFCNACGTRAVWQFTKGQRPKYTVTSRRM